MIKFKKLKYWRTEKLAPESGKTRVLRRRRRVAAGCCYRIWREDGTVILTGQRPSTVERMD